MIKLIKWLLQVQFGVCACVVHLCIDFKRIWHSCYPRGVKVPFETFVEGQGHT